MTKSVAVLAEELRQHLGKGFEEHVSLKDVTGTGVGGVADFYFTATTPDEIIRAITLARQYELPYAVLGCGSHSLMADYGFAGLVIANHARRMTFIPGRGQVIVESGVVWPELILAAAGRCLGGLSPLLALSGTVGGVLATGIAVPEVSPLWAVRSVTLLDSDGLIVQKTARQITKSLKPGVTILTATLQFVQARADQIAFEVSRYEKTRRGYQASDRRFVGPIFSVAGASRAFALEDLLNKSPVLGMKNGNAVFSSQRLNYLEIRGRTNARELRTLISRVYDELTEETAETLAVHIKFLGTWDESGLGSSA